ncbi:hypothetical protein G3I25_08725, partial [Streptomyces rochei]|nr:hypothetical protein [Streptomyces rochei]
LGAGARRDSGSGARGGVETARAAAQDASRSYMDTAVGSDCGSVSGTDAS